GTSLEVKVPRGPLTPFVPGEAPKEIAESSPAGAAEKRPRADLGGTSLEVKVPRGPALPFAHPPEPPAAPPRKPNKLAELSLNFQVPRELFQPRPAPPADAATAPPQSAPEPAPLYARPT